VSAVARLIAALKAFAIDFLMHNPWLRMRYRALRGRLRYLRYRWYARGPRDDALIVFESFVGRNYSGSPRALYEAARTDPRFARSRFVWAFRNPGHAAGFPALADPRTTIVANGTADYYRAFGRARAWVSNSIIAPELVPRADQHYLQTWHGTPFKRIGLDVVATTETALNGKPEIDERYRVDAGKITTFLSAAPFTTRVFASAFGLSAARGPFVETGNPRNDALATATPGDVAAARERLGIAPGTRVILYAPTWRDDQYDLRTGYVYEQPLDLGRLRTTLGDGWLVLYRAHYIVTNVIDFAGHDGFVRDVSGIDDINELALASDVLVTDYSSVYFDFALLDRPMIFYMYDLERYASRLRGFYLPFEDVPGPIVSTQDDLAAALLDPDLPARDAARRAELNATMSPHDDGRATCRVLDILAGAPRAGAPSAGEPDTGGYIARPVSGRHADMGKNST
jgi:CDP-glycerol glycerophosphotransferase